MSAVPTDDVCELSNLLQIHDKEIGQSNRQLLSLEASIVSQEEQHANEIQSFHRKLGKLGKLQSDAHHEKQKSDLGYATVLKLLEELKEAGKLDTIHTIYNLMEQEVAGIQRSSDENTNEIIELTLKIDDIETKFCLKELKQKLNDEEREQRKCEEMFIKDKEKLQIIEEKLKKLEILVHNNDAESLRREIIQYRSQKESDNATIISTIANIADESKRFAQYENSLRSQLKELEIKNTRLQSDHDAVLNLTFDLENIIRKLEGSSAAAMTIINAHGNQENELNAKIAHVLESLKIAEDDIHKHQREIYEIKSGETSAESRLEKAECAISSFLERRSIESLLMSTSVELDELTQSCESVEMQIQLLRDTGLQGHAPPTFLQLNDDLDNATKRLSGIVESIKEKENQNAELEQTQTNLAAHKGEIQSRNKSLIASMEDVQQQLVASHKDVSELRRNICRQYKIDEKSVADDKNLTKSVENVTALIENIKDHCESRETLATELTLEIEKLSKERDDIYINLQKVTQRSEESYNREARVRAEADLRLKISRAKDTISVKKTKLIEQMYAEVVQADEIFQKEHLEAISEIATKKQLLTHTLEKLKSEESIKRNMRNDSMVSRPKSYDYLGASQSSRHQSFENLVNINGFDADLSQIAVSEAPHKSTQSSISRKIYAIPSGPADQESIDRKRRPKPQEAEQEVDKRPTHRPLHTRSSSATPAPHNQLSSTTPAPHPLKNQLSSTTPATPATGYRRLAVSKNVALTDIMKRK